jgi:hypothetical protein
MLAHSTCSQALYTALMHRYIPFQMFLDFYQHAAKPGMPKWPYTAAHHNLGLLIPMWFQFCIWSFAMILNDFIFKLKTQTFNSARYSVNFGDNDTGLHSPSFYESVFHWLSREMSCQLQYGQGESNLNKLHYAKVCSLCTCYSYAENHTKSCILTHIQGIYKFSKFYTNRKESN